MARIIHARRGALVLGAAGLAVVAAACGGSSSSSSSSSSASSSSGGATPAASSSSGGSTSGQSLNILMVGNSQMTDIQKLTADNFTKDTGIKVNFTVLDENSLRAKVTQDISNKTGAYDVVTIGGYEAPIWAKNKWLTDLTDYATKDSEFDVSDVFKPLRDASGIDGKLYAMPFYGESSMLMYRKDLVAAAGLTMPERPTWTQVAAVADKLTDKAKGVSGICLRGKKGWGEMFAPLTTVVNTFGGTWFTKDWQAQVNSPAFTQAATFYTDLIKKDGEPDPQNAGFTECQTAMAQGKAAMWYDATSGAGVLEDKNSSTVAGKLGYAFAPVEKTKVSGWLWSWDWAVPSTSKKADAAWKFISWASSKKYENLVGAKLGWSRVPDGKRQSTYAIAAYKAQAPYADIVKQSIEGVDPLNPGVQPRPTQGIQYVDIPEFANLGDAVSSDLGEVLTGQKTVKQALDAGQSLAESVAKDQQ